MSRNELIEHVGRLAQSPTPVVLCLDGYPGSGKTTLAMALGRVPGVAWVPLDGFRLNESFDYKRLNKEVFKPFRKKAVVRRVVPKNPLARIGPLTAKGEAQTGIRVLVLEGMESALAYEGLKTDLLCWVDCARQVRIDRLDARGDAYGGGFVELSDWIEQAEMSGLREKALDLAHFVTDTTSGR